MQIVSNWRVVWKKFSVQALAIATLAQGVLSVLPAAWLAYPVPFMGATTYGSFLVGATIAIQLIGLIGAYIDQGLPPNVPQVTKLP